jgi:branched-chain amino acid aminotransferase
MELARANGITVHERHIMPEELARAQEVFLTGTAAEITPVSEIDGQKFVIGAVSKTLMAAYSAATRAHTKAAAYTQFNN